MWQTDGTVYKLKPRSFHKSAYLQTNLVNFHPQCELHLTARRKGFKLKKIERAIYIRNVNGNFDKKRPIEYMVEVNIYY